MIEQGARREPAEVAANTIKSEDRIVITVTQSQEVFVEKERVNIAKLRDVLNAIREEQAPDQRLPPGGPECALRSGGPGHGWL